MTTVYTETLQRAGCFIVREANGTRSRALAVLNHASGNILAAGTVLGKIETGNTSTTTAKAGNTGNGTMGTVTVGDTADAGRHRVRITAAAANAGSFDVINPEGDVIGQGTVAVAFNGGGLSFTLADGSTDFVVGDEFYINVSPNAGEKWTALDLAGTNGEDVAAGILFDAADASAADAKIVVIARDCEINSSELVWPSGFTSAQKAAGLAQLANVGIVSRPVY